jgi:peptidoglycan/LPS O-acetylase OafA/YrhL
MLSRNNGPKYFHSMDIIRGFAALVVVLFHWQHFYFSGDVAGVVPDKTLLPLYAQLSLLYDDGFLAVDLFFLLSGFIFYWLYANRLANGKTSSRQFFGYRFTRLYPMHIVTLISVAILQWQMFRQSGHYFIYPFNDAYHFTLNIFLVNSWGLEKGPSFNAPCWTISVEVLMYLLFFVICRFRLHTKISVAVVLVVIGAVVQHYYSPVGQALYSFFLGAIVYRIYQRITQMQQGEGVLRFVFTATCLLWIFILCEYKFSFLRSGWEQWMLHKRPGMAVQSVTAVFDLARNVFFRTIVSPFSILSLALMETRYGQLNKKWAIAGNCSYAMYLMHFSLQLVFLLIVDAWHIDRNVFHSPYLMLFFFALLIPISAVAYYYFEFPLQEILRTKFIRSKEHNLVVKDASIVT